MNLKLVLNCFYFVALILAVSCASDEGGSSGSSKTFYTEIALDKFYDDTISSYGSKVYLFETNEAGDYTIALTNPGSDLTWSLYSYDRSDRSINDITDDNVYITNGIHHYVTNNQIATINLNASTHYFIIVDEWDDTGDGSYSIQVTFDWDKIYGGPILDYAYCAIPSNSGGYMVAGVTYSYSDENSTDAWIIKTDKNGNELWNQTYGGSSEDSAEVVVTGNDGGYVLAGYTYSYNTVSSDVWIFKIDEHGNELWNKTFGGLGTDRAYALISGNNGGYVIAGNTSSFGEGTDAWIIKIDENGNELWNQTYGGSSGDWAKAVVPGNNGGYVIAGSTSFFGESTDVWIFKIDEDGNELWNKTFGGTDSDNAESISPGNNGGYVIAGGTLSYGEEGSDVWVIKIDEDGNALWDQTFGHYRINESASSVIQGNYGGYVIAGRTYLYGNLDAWIFKIDEDGNMLANQTYGGNSAEIVHSVHPGDNSGYVMAGQATTLDGGDVDALVIKIGEDW